MRACAPAGVKDTPLDLGEKHSLVIARQASEPLNRREVGRGDRLIFAQWRFPAVGALRNSSHDNWSICSSFTIYVWRALVGTPAAATTKRGVGRRLTANPHLACPLNVTWPTVNAASLCWPSDDVAFEKSTSPRWGGRFSIDRARRC